MTIIRTYTGGQVDIENPTGEQIRIEDIAHALSFLCRGSGQTRVFFSVARHCVYCAREALQSGQSRRVALICLLHDASEAYMADVPRPIKTNLIPAYTVYEKQLLDCIYQKYLGDIPQEGELAAARRIDDRLLQYDLKYLLGADVTLPSLAIEADYAPMTFGEAENMYLDIFKQLTEGNQ